MERSRARITVCFRDFYHSCHARRRLRAVGAYTLLRGGGRSDTIFIRAEYETVKRLGLLKKKSNNDHKTPRRTSSGAYFDSRVETTIRVYGNIPT